MAESVMASRFFRLTVTPPEDITEGGPIPIVAYVNCTESVRVAREFDHAVLRLEGQPAELMVDAGVQIVEWTLRPVSTGPGSTRVGVYVLSGDHIVQRADISVRIR